MGRLTTLKSGLAKMPNRLPTIGNSNPRPAGRGWQATRLRIQIRDGSMCAKCGLLWNSERDKVDHAIPRWAGGSDTDSNLWLLHDECHQAKSDEEAAMRGAYAMPQWVADLLAKDATASGDRR